jgi:hypothetical protein
MGESGDDMTEGGGDDIGRGRRQREAGMPWGRGRDDVWSNPRIEVVLAELDMGKKQGGCIK